MSETLSVERRTKLGKRNNERLRRDGRLPAVLYGHGEEALSLSIPVDQFDATLRHGAKVVDLEGAASGQALLQDVQWDTFFQHVLHVDLLRIVAGELITVTVAIDLRGESPGALGGGVIEQLLHEVEIEVTPAKLPDKLHVNINHLELGQTLTLKDIIDLPEGARLIGDLDEAVVHCVEPFETAEVEAGVGTLEPELIGHKPEEEKEGED
jgi:large subunit ribosomal protein L25